MWFTMARAVADSIPLDFNRYQATTGNVRRRIIRDDFDMGTLEFLRERFITF